MKYLNKRKIHLTRPYDPALSMCSRPIRGHARRAHYRKTFNKISEDERCKECDKIANGAPPLAYWAGKTRPSRKTKAVPPQRLRSSQENTIIYADDAE